MGADGRQFVFVLGPARSGTSLLRDMIAAHPQCAVVPHDVTYVWRHGNASWPDDAIPASRLTPRIAARIEKQLARFARRAGGAAEFIVEKTVGNALRPEFVQAAFPGARFIQIVRDPAETISSSIEAWHRPPGRRHLIDKLKYYPVTDFAYGAWFLKNRLKGKLRHGRGQRLWGARYPGIEEDVERLPLATVCARQWLASVETTDGFLDGLDEDRYRRVRYEDLAAGPQALAAVWRFLGIADDGLAAELHEEWIRPAQRARPSLPGELGVAELGRIAEACTRHGYPLPGSGDAAGI